MSHNYNTSYRDPYAEQGAEYLDDRGHPQSGPRDGNADDYYPQYNSYGAEKTTPNDVDTDVGGTERLQPGRANLGQGPESSFAAMGPPPRSTGILRMWRKDERGKQWTRVGTACGGVRAAAMGASVGGNDGACRLARWASVCAQPSWWRAEETSSEEARNVLIRRVAVPGVLAVSSYAA